MGVPGVTLGQVRKDIIMDQLLRLVKRLNDANLCTERDELGEFCAKKRPCPIHEPELYTIENIDKTHPDDWKEREQKMFGERPLTIGDAPQVPQPIPIGGKDGEK